MSAPKLSAFTVTRSTQQAPDTAEPVIDWRQDGACIGEDPELFYPAPSDLLAIKSATEICADCPVRTQCLADAIARREAFGIWGGTDERTRERIFNRRGQR